MIKQIIVFSFFLFAVLTGKNMAADPAIVNAREMYVKALETQNKTMAIKAASLMKQALEQNKKDHQLQQTYYVVCATNVITFHHRESIAEAKKLFDVVYRYDKTMPPPSYLEATFLDKNATRQKIDLLKKALRENPYFSDTYIDLGDAFIRLHRFHLARDILKRGMRMTQTDLVRFHYFLLLSYEEESYYAEEQSQCGSTDKTLIKKMIKEAKNVLKLKPDLVEIHMQLATAYERLGQRTLALAAAKKATADSSEESRMIYNGFLLGNGKKKQFFQRIKQGEKADLILLMEAYFYDQQWKKAAQVYKKYFVTAKGKDLFYKYYWYANSLRLSGKETEGKNILKNLPAEIKRNSWERLLEQFFFGQVDEEELLQHAKNACQKTEALFWTGMQYIHSDHEKAKRYFKKVIDEKVYAYKEYAASRYYLEEGIKIEEH